MRVDFNVPLKNGRVAEDFRVQGSVPTIQYLLKQGAGIVVVSHLGRPKGYDKKLSLLPIVSVLEKYLKVPVQFVPFKNEATFNRATRFLTVAPGSVVLLENIRFLEGEEKNSVPLAKTLAKLAHYFVSDCFAVAHRTSASITGVAKFLPSFAGLLMEKEVITLGKVMRKPKQPLVLVLGGAKAETKIPIIKNFLSSAQSILVSGGIANTYWAATGHNLGTSLVDVNKLAIVKRLCSHKNIVLPIDVVVGSADGKKNRVELLSKKLHLKQSEAIWEIGPATVELFAKIIKKANTIILNGATGRFEVHPYEQSTFALSRLVAARSKGKAFGVVGGGETVQVIKNLGLEHDIDFVSTGGGAMLEFLGGKKLPGVQVVTK